MKPIDTIVIHCSGSSWGSASDIRHWHVDERGWRDIGYHFVILNGDLGQGLKLPCTDGSIEAGRHLDATAMMDAHEVGAHALGMNDHSIGICMIGSMESRFTDAQMLSLKVLVSELMLKFDIKLENVIGHNEILGVFKNCPCFSVKEEIREKL